VPRFTKLPWIPSDEQWHQILEMARVEPLRNRFMLALAYDAALRREELCLLRTDDLDPALRTLRVRAETTKNRRERVIPYSAATGELLRAYLQERRTMSLVGVRCSSRSRIGIAPLRSPPGRGRGDPGRRHTRRHPSLQHTHAAASLPDGSGACWLGVARDRYVRFAAHRSLATTLQYIHLSGRDLASKLARGMAEVHAWRIAQIGELLDGSTSC
jgi:integrase